MSRVKTTVLAAGLIAVVAVAFVGATSFVASSSKHSSAAASGCGGDELAVAATPAAGSGCDKTAAASKSCASAKVSEASDKGCPVTSCPLAKAGCSKTCGSKSTKTAKIESIGEREGSVVVLTGRYVCGTCDLGVKAEDGRCQPAFQAKDGKNYLLAKNNLSEKLRDQARDKDVEISSRVKKMAGAKYLEVEAVRAAS